MDRSILKLKRSESAIQKISKIKPLCIFIMLINMIFNHRFSKNMRQSNILNFENKSPGEDFVPQFPENSYVLRYLSIQLSKTVATVM